MRFGNMRTYFRISSSSSSPLCIRSMCCLKLSNLGQIFPLLRQCLEVHRYETFSIPMRWTLFVCLWRSSMVAKPFPWIARRQPGTLHVCGPLCLTICFLKRHIDKRPIFLFNTGYTYSRSEAVLKDSLHSEQL